MHKFFALICSKANAFDLKSKSVIHVVLSVQNAVIFLLL